mmetsp:Transcript_7362/g.21648  ORF Transcript_7362/g.21648 Transcript_7362/m.21648 type:complete len:378 (+) Transcript_7362:916-2049(+)
MRRGHLCVSPHDGHPRVGGVEAREGRAGDEVARGGREEQAPARRLHRQGVHHTGGDGERGGEGRWEGRADKAVAGGEIGALIRGETRGLAVRVRHDARLGIEAAVRLSGAPAALAVQPGALHRRRDGHFGKLGTGRVRVDVVVAIDHVCVVAAECVAQHVVGADAAHLDREPSVATRAVLVARRPEGGVAGCINVGVRLLVEHSEPLGVGKIDGRHLAVHVAQVAQLVGVVQERDGQELGREPRQRVGAHDALPRFTCGELRGAVRRRLHLESPPHPLALLGKRRPRVERRDVLVRHPVQHSKRRRHTQRCKPLSERVDGCHRTPPARRHPGEHESVCTAKQAGSNELVDSRIADGPAAEPLGEVGVKAHLAHPRVG